MRERSENLSEVFFLFVLFLFFVSLFSAAAFKCSAFFFVSHVLVIEARQ